MKIKELVDALQKLDPESNVTLWDVDTGWLLPIRIVKLEANGSDRLVDFVAITGDFDGGIEGHASAGW